MYSDLEIADRLIKTSKSARERKLDFNLSFRTMKRLMNTKKCFFTNVIMNDKHENPFQRTIDRIDNSKGYVEGNVVACTRQINMRKGSLNVDEIVMMYNGLKKKKLV